MRTHPSSLIFLIAPLAFAYEPDIILDAHSDAGAVQLEPSSAWSDDTTTTDAFRANAKVINSTTANTGEYARFHTTLPVTGRKAVPADCWRSNDGPACRSMAHFPGLSPGAGAG